MEVQIPLWEWASLRERCAHCKVQGLTAVSCAKTAEPTEMPFGMWNRVGPMKHVLDAHW